MTREIDEQGYFVSDKHFMADFILEEIVSLSVQDFLPGMVIVGSLQINKQDDVFEIDFVDTSYGASGIVRAKKIRLEFVPGRKRPQ